MRDGASDQNAWLGAIAKTLAFLCVHATELREAELGPKAALLESFGLPRKDVAMILNTTEDSVRMAVHRVKRGKAKRRGRRKKK